MARILQNKKPFVEKELSPMAEWELFIYVEKLMLNTRSTFGWPNQGKRELSIYTNSVITF